MATTEQPAPIPIIFKAPLEIRLHIYAYAIAVRKWVSLHEIAFRRGLTPSERAKRFSGTLAMVPSYNNFALTCRQAYRETRHLFYNNTPFVTNDTAELDDFIKDTRSENLALIPELHLRDPQYLDYLDLQVRSRLWERSEPYGMSKLHYFQGLKILSIYGPQASRILSKKPRQYSSLQILRGLISGI